MKQNLFARSGRPLISKVVYDGSLKKSIEQAASLIGGFDKLVEKGDTVLLKPNYNTADPFPGSSDPQFIKNIIELLYEAGARKVVVGERTAFLHSRRVLEQAGIIKVAKKAGAEVKVFGKDGWQVIFDRSGWRCINVPYGQYLRKVSVAKEAIEIKKIVYWWTSKGNITRAQLNFSLWRPSGIDVEGVKILQSYPGNSLEGRNPWGLTQIRHAIEIGLGPHNEQEYKIENTITKRN